MSKAASAKPLIQAQDVNLTVPVMRQDDRKLLGNPWALISNIYFGRGSRKQAVLLNNISFELHKGDRIGLIGGNGAGKSTLLRLLAGIYAPSSGRLAINGLARGLFDLNLGMQPLASGLENIYLRGLQMGLSLKEIRENIPEILAFCELGEHISKPLGTYSSGMRLRLSLAVSTIIKPDILLLDEWIGTGDSHFKKKIAGHMESLVDASSGLIIATHSHNLMKQFCNKALVLDQGRIVFVGDVDDAQDYYQSTLTDGDQRLKLVLK